MKSTHTQFKRASLSLALAALTTAMASHAFADTSDWYLGGNIGKSHSLLDDADTTRDLLGTGYTVNSVNDDKNDTGFKIYGGYDFNKNFALEAGYFDLGETSFTANITPTGTFGGTTKVNGWFVDLVGTAHFTEKLSGFARVGIDFAKPKESFTGAGLVPLTSYHSNERDSNVKYGIGLQYDFTEKWGARLEAERYRIQDGVANRGDINLVSLGVVYHFGKHAVPAPVRNLPPVVNTPAPTQEYCTKLDINFEINRDAVQRADKEKLNVVGSFLNKYPGTSGTIEGRADDVGTDTDNQSLSERRAQNVIRYLEENLHVSNGRLKAVGYGESRPTSDNQSEEGKRNNRRIDAVISCATDVQGLKQLTPRVTTSAVVHFDRNKVDVTPQYREELEKVASFLKENPTVTATVEGHTDNSNPASAQKVSTQRAQNVVNYLVNNFGVPRSQLTAEGFGDTRRVAYNTSAEGKQENRRANIILNYPNVQN